MKKILIAIDYAPSTQQVIEQGYALAMAMNAEVILLHVIEDVTHYASSIYNPIMGFGGFINLNFLGDDVLGLIVDEAKLFLGKIKLHLQDSSIKTLVIQGDIADVILETAGKMNVSLIASGMHSRGRMEEFLLGSTAQKLLKNTTIPLYIIPIKKEQLSRYFEK